MSAVLALFNRGAQPLDDAIVEPMLAPLGRLGSSTAVSRPAAGVVLAASCFDWERREHLSGDLLVFEDDQVVVAADARLHYRADLMERLAMAGQQPGGPSPSHLIAAAWKAWGARCVERLEGDFAFVLYDRHQRAVLCGRDHLGRRPLFYADLGDTLAVGSSIASLLAHPDCSAALNLAVIGSAAANLIWSCGSDTCYQAVRVVPMAGTLRWDGQARLATYWDPAHHLGETGIGFAQGAEELRELLAQAVAERLSPSGPSAVWMSGGYDSTAVFGAAQHALRDDRGERSVIPVSISYPPGDIGREDDLIKAVADFWDAPVHWLDIDDIPMFERDEGRAAERDEPTTSPYLSWNLALARGARACGARTALDGNGGDQVFSGTDIYLADLLIRGRWLTLTRELHARRDFGARHLARSTLLPVVAPIRRIVAGLRARKPVRHYLEGDPPAWVRADFAQRHQLVERQRAFLPEESLGRRSETELVWSLRLPVLGYAQGLIHAPLLEAGVVVGAPLLDRRVIELALRRPRSERIARNENKRLLRASMRGLLPERILAPRRRRTGLTLSYSRRSMRAGLPRLYDEIFRSSLVLADLGVVDPSRLRQAVAQYVERDGEQRRLALFHTLQTELWLRSHRSQL